MAHLNFDYFVMLSHVTVVNHGSLVKGKILFINTSEAFLNSC